MRRDRAGSLTDSLRPAEARLAAEGACDGHPYRRTPQRLSALYGHEAYLNAVLDPRFVSGMTVRVGEERPVWRETRK
jgi:hypothetical protein